MSMRREEDRIGRAPGPGPNRRRIEFTVGEKISSPDMSATILGAWAEVGGQRVSEIDVGQKFDIKVQYKVNWPEYGFPIIAWVFGLTAIGDGVKVYDNTQLFGRTAEGIMTLDNPKSPTMPDHDVILTIQPWGSAHTSDYSKPPWEG